MNINKIFKLLFMIVVLSNSINSELLSSGNKNYDKHESENYFEFPNSLIALKNYYKINQANQYNNSFNYSEWSSSKTEEIGYKSPWLAFGLAMTFPGLGQLYNGEYGKLGIIYGIAVVGAGIGIIAISNSNWGTSKPEPSYVEPLGLTGIGLISLAWIYSLIDAPISANRINERNTHQKSLEIVSYVAKKYTLSLDYNKTISNYMLKVYFNF